MKDCIYLDTNATTPLAPEVQGAIINALTNGWGNASSSTSYGRKAKEYIDQARVQTADMIDAQPHEIIFTSGGTESNHTVLHTFAKSKRFKGQMGEGDISRPHIVTTNIEHDSIRKPLEKIHNDGIAQVTFVQVDKTGHAVCVEDIMKSLQTNTVLVTIMLANNETGVIQPVKEIADAIKEYNETSGQRIYLHTDAAQAIGKIPVSVETLGVDYLTIVGHKFYGPRIGALFVRNLADSRKECPLTPVFIGGGQERAYRAGTENTAMISGLGAACQLVTNNLSTYQLHMQELRDQLESELKGKFNSQVTFNGKSSLTKRLPNTCNLSIIGETFKGNLVLENCQQVVAGVGAACHSKDSHQGSSVLIASGIPREVACNAIRLSVGRETTSQCITGAVNDLWKAVQSIS